MISGGWSNTGDLTRLFQAYRTIDPLPQARERELLRVVADEPGTPAAQEATDLLVRANMRFVFRQALRFTGNGVPLEDLVAAGAEGLLEAINRFETEYPYKLYSYGAHWIRQRLNEAVANDSRCVRPSLNAVGRRKGFVARTAELEQLFNRDVTDADVIESMIDSGELRTECEAYGLAHARARECSLDAPLDGPDRDDRRTVGDTFTADDVDFDSGVDGDRLRAALDDLCTIIPERSVQLLRSYFGLGSDAPMTLTDVGVAFGITRERVRQLLENALSEFRAAIVRQDMPSTVALSELASQRNLAPVQAKRPRGVGGNTGAKAAAEEAQRERDREKRRRYSAEYREKQTEYMRQYRERNAEKVAAYQREYRKANADKLNVYHQQYRNAQQYRSAGQCRQVRRRAGAVAAHEAA